MLGLALALQLMTDGGAAAPSAPGLPNFVQVVAIAGLPSDSLVRQQFMSGFRGVFADDELPAERRHGSGEWEHSVPVSNRFKMLESEGDGGYGAEDAWLLRVTIGAPPAVVLRKRAGDQGRRVLETHRRSRGMLAAFSISAPTPSRERGPDATSNFAFTFAGPSAPAEEGASVGVPAVGYLFPWEEAGRVVARLALEALLKQHRDMDDDERLAIDPAMRVESGR